MEALFWLSVLKKFEVNIPAANKAVLENIKCVCLIKTSINLCLPANESQK